MTLDPGAVEARLAEMDHDIALAEHLVEYLEAELDDALRRLNDCRNHKARTVEAIEAVTK